MLELKNIPTIQIPIEQMTLLQEYAYLNLEGFRAKLVN